MNRMNILEFHRLAAEHRRTARRMTLLSSFTRVSCGPVIREEVFSDYQVIIHI